MPDLNDKRLRQKAFKSLTQDANNARSICETLRIMYDLVHDMEDSETKTKLVEYLIDCMMMSKAMNDRLIYYHDTYSDTTGKAGKGVEKLYGSEGRKNLRRSR